MFRSQDLGYGREDLVGLFISVDMDTDHIKGKEYTDRVLKLLWLKDYKESIILKLASRKRKAENNNASKSTIERHARKLDYAKQEYIEVVNMLDSLVSLSKAV